MRGQHADGLTLFGPSGSRKYLDAVERIRFERAATRAPPRVGLFCLTLAVDRRLHLGSARRSAGCV
jgi:integrase/recombinase XerD